MYGRLKDDQKRASGTVKMPWRQLLDKVDSINLWSNTKREDREPWKNYFQRAEELLMRPRSNIPRTVIVKILSGDFTEVDTTCIPTAQPRVAVFVSSTFTDTKAERNHLMKDVYPFVRKISRRLGMDFVTIDMRWGVTEEATNDHKTIDMCMDEIKRCIKDSCGPAFLCFLSHKYGFRPLPPSIDQDEFNQLLNYLKKADKDTSLIESYYNLDLNAVPPAFELKQMPRGKDQGSWWSDVERIQILFREAVVATYNASDPRCDKYHVSVTEKEIQEGVFNNPNAKDQVTVILRDLSDYQSEFHRDRKILDMKEGEIDSYAMEKLTELKEKKICHSVPEELVKEIAYDEPVPENCCQSLRSVCDYVCKVLTESILKRYASQFHVNNNMVFNEVLQHRNLANSKAELFVGKESEIQAISNYACGKTDRRKPLVVHGVSGCGKTALMAMSARTVKQKLPEAVVVLRFLGTTGHSGAVRALLLSTIHQICQVYNKSTLDIPDSYKDLIQYFRESITFATAEKPLILFFDSLDQLSNEDFGQNLAWLPLLEDLPNNVRLVLSSLPTQCLDILKERLPAESFIEVRPLSKMEGPEIVTKMLGMANRTVTNEQKEVIMNAFNKCPLPLYLRLVVDIVMEWHSFDQIKPTDLPDTIQGLITMLFGRLERRYGQRFVQRSLSYITVAKFGLSLNELEDILSCDDDVLDDIFKFWIPPVRRIPSMLWARVRNEIGQYLVEKGADGMNTYGWFHRQFWEIAEKRYLNEVFGDEKEPYKAKAHRAVADYFEGVYEAGKLYVDVNGKQIFEDRKVLQQPNIVAGNRQIGRQLNRRKLSELPYHLIRLRDWDRFNKLAIDLSYIEAKFEADMGYSCLSEFIEATRLSNSECLKQMTRFIGSTLSFLINEPYAVYQLAHQQSKKHPAKRLLELQDKTCLPMALMVNMDEAEFDDACEMTLLGHTETLRCCAFSPKGDMILSAADDRTMRLWDSLTGAELVTVSGLPEPIFPDKTESQKLMLHPVNPCCFSRDGGMIASGTEAGDVKLWSLSGAELKSVKTAFNQVTYIQFSPNNRLIATVHRDSTVSFWKPEDLSMLGSVTTNTPETTGLDFSHNGKLVAVSSASGLTQISTERFKIVTKQKSPCMSLCCTYYTDDKQVMTGGSDSCVIVWDVGTGQSVDKLASHRAWIWSIVFTLDGRFMFTGSSDRTMKIWQNTKGRWNPMVSVGGHSHRVSMMSLDPSSGQRLVSSSLDRSLKVWDVQTLLSGQLSAVAGLHYNICLLSPSGRYLVTSQGWSRNCFVFKVDGMENIGTTPSHTGFIKQVVIPPDDEMMVVLDHGHSGAYEMGAEKNAVAKVISLPDLALVIDLPVMSPMAVTLVQNSIFVISISEEICQFSRKDMSEVRRWPSGLPGSYMTLTGNHMTGLLVATGNKAAKVWKISNDAYSILDELPSMESRIGETAISPDGTFLAFGLNSGVTDVYTIKNGKLKLNRSLKKDSSYVKDINFSAEGNFMLTSAGLSMRIWDMRDGVELVSTYYAPVNKACLLNGNIVIAGEATGSLSQLSFEMESVQKLVQVRLNLEKVIEESEKPENVKMSRRAVGISRFKNSNS